MEIDVLIEINMLMSIDTPMPPAIGIKMSMLMLIVVDINLFISMFKDFTMANSLSMVNVTDTFMIRAIYIETMVMIIDMIIMINIPKVIDMDINFIDLFN